MDRVEINNNIKQIPKLIQNRRFRIILVIITIIILYLIFHQFTNRNTQQSNSTFPHIDQNKQSDNNHKFIDWEDAEIIPSIATTPLAHVDTQPSVWWNRYNDITGAIHKSGKSSNILFIGDSITARWLQQGAAQWNNMTTNELLQPINLGIDGDQTQHILYRLLHEHGQRDLYDIHKIKCIVLLCGTNNGYRAATESIQQVASDTINGMMYILQLLDHKFKHSTIILLNILPRQDTVRFVHDTLVNQQLNQFDREDGDLIVLDIRQQFLTQSLSNIIHTLDSGSSNIYSNNNIPLNNELYADGLHLTQAGYQIMYDSLLPHIRHAIQHD